MTAPRPFTDVDRLADEHLDRTIAHDPLVAVSLGVPGGEALMPALDPDWFAQRSQERRRTLAALAAAEPADASDRVTIAALRDALEIAEGLRELGDEESNARVIDSPVQNVREAFDLVPTATEGDWASAAARLAAVPGALRGYTASLRLAAEQGHVRPRRQIEAAIAQSLATTGPDGFFATFAREAAADDGSALPESLRRDLEANAAAAADAYAQLAGVLRDELLPRAGERDAVGRERYALHSRRFVGARLDLDESYAWGQAELARIDDEMRRTADRIVPGGSVADAIEALEADPARKLAGTDALQEWMQQRSDEAIAALADTHFDIPREIRRLECRIAPTHDGVIYYTGPSDDLTTRPGRMWWSVPEGVTEFGTWRELTTVYHEGVPGHHLQIAQTVYRRDQLNRWRRLGCWTSGYGEGWALYAERLMADLGYLDDPGDYLGMLDGQSMRAARVVLDIGIHCELPAPAEVGGGEWTYDKAYRFLSSHVNMADGFVRYELDRYLGWPGQAPAYKLGERYWLQLRDEARAREGAAFDLKDFHRRALDIGAVGLDVLGEAMRA